MDLLTFSNDNYTHSYEVLVSNPGVLTSVHALSEWLNGKFAILHPNAPDWSCFFGTRPGVGA